MESLSAGGAFTEAAAIVFSQLGAALRQQILQAAHPDPPYPNPVPPTAARCPAV